MEVVRVVQRWHRMEKRPDHNECRERIRMIVERTLMGKAKVNSYNDSVAETERVNEGKRVRVERGAHRTLE